MTNDHSYDKPTPRPDTPAHAPQPSDPDASTEILSDSAPSTSFGGGVSGMPKPTDIIARMDSAARVQAVNRMQAQQGNQYVQRALGIGPRVQRDNGTTPAPAPAVTPAPAPGSDKPPDLAKPTFKGSFKSFAPNFDLEYVPGQPAPAVGKVEVTLRVLIEYKDFDKDVAKEEPFKSYFRRHPLTAAQKADFAWSVKEKEEIGKKFQADFKAQVSAAWSGKHRFHLKDPDFSEYLADAQIKVETTENPGDKYHNKMAVQKVPKGIDARYRSNVRQGDRESTLDYRDASVNEKHKNEAYVHEYVKQVKPFGFDNAELTPDLTGQVDSVAADIRKLQDPAKKDSLLGEKYAVDFTGRASSKGEKSYNEKLGLRRAVAVEQRLAADLGRPGSPSRARSVGEEHASEDEKFQRVDVLVWNVEKAFSTTNTPETDQNVAAHEAGHMFGLDDEYIDEKPDKGKPKFLGDEPDHYDKVKELMGEDAAKELVMDESSSIMSGGMDVKRGHYVYFLEALNSVTSKKWSVE